MERLGMEILFLLPITIENQDSRQMQWQTAASEEQLCTLGKPDAGHVVVRAVHSAFCSPYHSNAVRMAGMGAVGGYDGDLIGKVWAYAERCFRLAKDEQFDVIHAHDWLTFPAGMTLAAQSGRPLIVQIHATEFDRSGQDLNEAVYNIERQGLHAATTVIAVSHLTKRILVECYGVPPEKIEVVHNGIEPKSAAAMASAKRRKEKIVLFLGRITMQKGPEFFVRAAAKVLQRLDNVKFVMAGWGDLAPRVVEQVAAMGLGRRIHFTGFLRGKQVERAYGMADVYVMPSVSEPFGLTALEAIQHGVPTILSKSSGVAEVLKDSVLKVDFWDVQQISIEIIELLQSSALAQRLGRNGREEIQSLTWDAAAQKCVVVYQKAVEQFEPICE
jgi:glycosyltransferase involved in cell wall biosynthesis